MGHQVIIICRYTMNLLQTSYGWVGVLGPYILILVSCILLLHQPASLVVYLLGMALNTIINLMLKGAIRQDRPKHEIPLCDLGLRDGKRYNSDKYGMPSGHSQSIGFSLAYIAATLGNPVITCAYAILSVITLTQRYVYRNHTIPQIAVGFLLGLVLGYTFYRLSKRAIKK